MTFCCNAVIKSITNEISVILYPLHNVIITPITEIKWFLSSFYFKRNTTRHFGTSKKIHKYRRFFSCSNSIVEITAEMDFTFATWAYFIFSVCERKGQECNCSVSHTCIYLWQLTTNKL